LPSLSTIKEIKPKELIKCQAMLSDSAGFAFYQHYVLKLQQEKIHKENKIIEDTSFIVLKS